MPAIWFNNLTSDANLGNASNYSEDQSGSTPYAGSLDSSVDIYLNGTHANMSGFGTAYLLGSMECASFQWTEGDTTVPSIQWEAQLTIYHSFGTGSTSTSYFGGGQITANGSAILYVMDGTIDIQYNTSEMPCLRLFNGASVTLAGQVPYKFLSSRIINQPCVVFENGAQIYMSSPMSIEAFENSSGQPPLSDGSGNPFASISGSGSLSLWTTNSGLLGAILANVSLTSLSLTIEGDGLDTTPYNDTIVENSANQIYIYHPSAVLRPLNLTLGSDITTMTSLNVVIDGSAAVTLDFDTYYMSLAYQLLLSAPNADLNLDLSASNGGLTCQSLSIESNGGTVNQGTAGVNIDTELVYSGPTWVQNIGAPPVSVESLTGNHIRLEVNSDLAAPMQVTNYSADTYAAIFKLICSEQVIFENGRVSVVPGEVSTIGDLVINNTVSAIGFFNGSRVSEEFLAHTLNVDSITIPSGLLISDVDMRLSPGKIDGVQARRAYNMNWGHTAGIDFRRNPV